MDPLSNSVIDGLRNDPKPQVQTNDSNQALKQEDFFALLTQQLSYQDPTKPVENDQMISQMTNFTMADGISGLNTNFESFAASMTSNQALQASSLVGQQVLVPGDTVVKHGDEPLSGTFNTPLSSHNTKVRIENDKGVLVRTIDLGEFPAGKHRFEWDGLNNEGNPAGSGKFKISIEGTVGNESTSLPVSTYAHVQSVSFGANGSGLTINTRNGSIGLSDIEEIGQG